MSCATCQTVRTHGGPWRDGSPTARAIPRALKLLKVELVRYLVARDEQKAGGPSHAGGGHDLRCRAPAPSSRPHPPTEGSSRLARTRIPRQAGSGRSARRGTLRPSFRSTTSPVAICRAVKPSNISWACVLRPDTFQRISDQALERGVHSGSREQDRRADKVLLRRREPPASASTQRSAENVDGVEDGLNRVMRAR